jgi:DNA repair exonuclease SbcCD ATPase subunit
MRSDDDWSAHARKAMEKALAQLNSNEGFNSDKWKAELQKSLEQALAGIEKASGDMRIRVQEWGGDGEGQNRVFVMPRGSTSQWNRAGDANEKLDRLSEQLERLNKRLADMEKKLAEHKQP